MKGELHMIVKILKGKNSRKFGERNLKNAEAHVKYVGFRSREIGDKHGFFSEKSNDADYKSFIERIKNNKALQHSETIKIQKLVFALKQEEYDIYKHSGKDLKDVVRDTIKQYEEKYNVKLDWVANVHHENEKNPHAHIIIKGVTDNAGDRGKTQRVTFDPKSAQDLRNIAQDHIDKHYDKEYAKEYWKEFYKSNPEKNNFKNNFEKEGENHFTKKTLERDMTKVTENVFKKLAQDIKKETGKAENQNQRNNENHFKKKVNSKDEMNRINKREKENGKER